MVKFCMHTSPIFSSRVTICYIMIYNTKPHIYVYTSRIASTWLVCWSCPLEILNTCCSTIPVSYVALVSLIVSPTYVRIWSNTYIYTYIRSCVRAYIRTYVCTYVCTHIHTYVQTYIHIHIYVHTYVRPNGITK